MANSAATFVAGLNETFAQQRSSENAVHMKAYLRDQFEFYGIKSPQRRDILRAYLAEHGVPDLARSKAIVTLCWQDPHREMQHTAMELLQRRVKELTLNDLPLLEHMVTHKSWWDTADFISYKLIGRLLASHADQQTAIARRHADSDNLWLMRVSLIFQLLRKEQTDTDLLAESIRKHQAHPDFFIRKAIGWALRDYSRTDPAWVKEFVAQTELSPLSKREALKHITTS